MIACWPAGIPQDKRGSFVRQHAALPDFMATALDLSGAKYPEKVPMHDGRSLLPLLQGSDAPIHPEPLYWEHEGNAAVRHGRWKLVREYNKPWELYDISADRTELQDLSGVRQDVRTEMEQMWTAWARETGVAFPQRFNMYEFLRKRRQQRQKNGKQ